ncbi:MAG: hypothetical protein R2748_33260 [Bryobacterales bacterium]
MTTSPSTTARSSLDLRMRTASVLTTRTFTPPEGLSTSRLGVWAAVTSVHQGSGARAQAWRSSVLSVTTASWLSTDLTPITSQAARSAVSTSRS